MDTGCFHTLPIVNYAGKINGKSTQKETKRKKGSYIYIRQTDFKPKTVTGNKEGYYIMIYIKESIHQEDITIVFMYPTIFMYPT